MYLQEKKPKSKVLILDSKDKFSKIRAVQAGVARHFPNHIEWVAAKAGGKVTRVDAKTNTMYVGDTAHKVAVANVIPAQQAGAIAIKAGLTDDKGWCPIDGRTFESTMQKGIHVIGDASVAKPLPKSGYAANSEGKTALPRSSPAERRTARRSVTGQHLLLDRRSKRRHLGGHGL